MRVAWRSLIGCLIVVLLSAAASAVFVLTQVDQLAGALSLNKSLDIKTSALASSSAGGPQTLLLVGNDQRTHTTTAPVLPHSNEMLLVRFDPSKPWISMMSIPRELLTTIQCPNGPATTRLNYSLTCGGFKTLVSTIKQVTSLSVNHVVMIDFNNFKRAVNDLGCAYTTVDRRYFHVNTPTSAQYQEINLQPGYQRICGTQALEFVSYRHGDTSLVRDARDQSFLLAAKQEYGPTLIDNIGKFERIFGRTVQTDSALHTSSGLLSLIDTLISSAGLPVRQVQFQVDLQPADPLAVACACVTATQQQVSASVHSFLYGSLHTTTRKTAALAKAIQHHARSVAHLALQAVPSVERSGARGAAQHLGFPLEFPSVQDELGPVTSPDIRDYLIHAPGGTAYPSYVAVFSTGLLGQYYDVQGTTWVTAPTFDSPAQTVRIHGRSYYLWYSGQHLLQVAWYAHHAMYWIHNTLTDALGNAQMLSIASQTTPVLGPHAVGISRPNLHSGAAPAVVTSTAPASLQHTIGLLGGLVVLAMLPLALLALVVHRRRLGVLRQQVHTAVGRVDWLQAQLPLPASAQPGFTSGATAAPGGWSAPSVSVAGPRRWLPTVVITGILAAAVAAFVLAGGHAAPRKRVVRPAPIPTAAVAVLNAGNTPGAAHRLAVSLQRQGAHISGVGNLGAATPAGYEVLYPPGLRTAGRRIAQLLRSDAPAVAPIDPAAQTAAGPAARIVVVIP